MNLKKVLVIARKEFKDVLRDRRTLFFMLLLPIAVMPLLMVLGSEFLKKQVKQKEAEVVTVAIDPTAESLVTGLAKKWFNDHKYEMLPILGTLIEGPIASLGDLKQVITQVRRMEEMEKEGGGVAGDTAMAGHFRAFLELSSEQRRFVRNAMAVAAIYNLTEFVSLDSVHGEGDLAPGVEIPDDLPAPLAEPRFSVAIQSKAIDAAVHVPLDLFDTLEQAALSVPFRVLHDSSVSRSDEAFDRFYNFISVLNEDTLSARLNDQHLSPAFIEPIRLEQDNIASQSRRVQAAIGGMLPYLIIIFCFFGAFYPSLDLTAGEKERFTLETLLLAPVSRLEIAAGKFLVVFAAAVTAAILATTSIGLTLTEGILPQGTAGALNLEFQPLAVWLTVSLLLPIAALFAALLLGVALLARSFKEAQSYTAPLQFVVIIPAIAAFIPDLQAETRLAWIPFVNVSMLMRELLKGNYLWDFYAITLISMLALTGLVLWGTSLLFRREAVLLRS